MRQGWMALALGGALALACVSLAPAGSPAWAAKKSEAVAVKKSGTTMRQFTGYVTALEKEQLTVEKRGKKPQSKTFTKHADLKTSGGDVEKEARVTVYYRDEGGRSIAHRVVVKAENGSKKG